MRKITSVAVKTKGRPESMEPPEGGWTYATLAGTTAKLKEGDVLHLQLGPMIEEGSEDEARELGAGDEDAPALLASDGLTASTIKAQNAGWEGLVKAQGNCVDKLSTLAIRLADKLEKVERQAGTGGGDGGTSLKDIIDGAKLLQGMINKKQLPAKGPDDEK